LQVEKIVLTLLSEMRETPHHGNKPADFETALIPIRL